MNREASRLSARQALVEEIAHTEKSFIRKRKLLEEINWDGLSKDAEEYLWSLIINNKRGFYD